MIANLSHVATSCDRKRIAERSQTHRKAIANASQWQRQRQRQNSYTYGRLFIIRHLGDARPAKRMMTLRVGETPC